MAKIIVQFIILLQQPVLVIYGVAISTSSSLLTMGGSALNFLFIPFTDQTAFLLNYLTLEANSIVCYSSRRISI